MPAKSNPNASATTARRGDGVLADRVQHAIREEIRTGVLQPGDRLLETSISLNQGVSRTPVRQALQRLQSEGLLEPAPGGGLAVRRYDIRAIAELYEMRASLEGTAAALAARHADETELLMLKALGAAQRKLPNDAQRHAEHNKTLHDHIHRAGHNRFLLQSLRGLHDALALLGHTTFVAPGRIAQSVGEHDAIIAAICAREPDQAEAAMRHHIRHAYELRIAAMAEDIGAGTVTA